MKKILCLALALVLCLSLFAGCDKAYDMESADLASFVTLGDVSSFSYDDLAAYYTAYRKALGESAKTFYMNTGYEIGMALTAEIVNEDGTLTTYAEWTKNTDTDYFKDYKVFRYADFSVFDKGLTYALEDATKSTQTPRLIRIGEAFSFTMPISEAYKDEAVAGKTVKFTVVVKEVLPSLYSDSDIATELQNFYTTYAESKLEVAMGDSVQIDYEGKIDGEAFEGGTAKDQSFVVGEGGFIDNFEEQLVGHKRGEEFDITVTFPADYDVETLAGKEAVFTITIDDISNDSDIIQKYTPFENLWELKEYYRIMYYIEYAIVDFVADNATLISLPEELVDDFRAIYRGYVEDEVMQAILDYAERGETYTKDQMMSLLYPSGADAYVDAMAEDAAYNYIIVHLLMKELGLTYTDKQYERDTLNVADTLGVTTVKEAEEMIGREILRLSFLDALCAPKLADRVTGIPVIGEQTTE